MTVELKTLERTLWRVASHPIRVQALTILTERVASPKEIADELGEANVGNVSYHVRELKKADLIELVGTKQRRGATEHFYRAIKRPMLSTEEWELLSIEERQRFSEWIIRLFIGDAAIAFDAGTFEARPERHLSRVPLHLDEQGWNDLLELQRAALERAFEIQAESDERRASSGEEGFPVSSTMASFEMPEGRRSKADRGAGSP